MLLLAQEHDVLDEGRPDLDATASVPGALHAKLLEQLRQYFIVGGMPEAVQAYVDTKSLAESGRVHDSICQAYLQDFLKYRGRLDRDCLTQVFERVPATVGQQLKYTALCPERRIEQIKAVLRVLEQSLVIRRVTAAKAQGLPLGADVAARTFKYICADIGLLRHLCGLSAAAVLAEKELLAVFRGGLAEQYIGQEMLAERGGSENGRLYYWARAQRNSSAEVDYLLVRNQRIVPVEVKSGPAGKLQSLKLFLAEHRHSPGGLVFHTGNVADMPPQRLRFLPLYTRMAEPKGGA